VVPCSHCEESPSELIMSGSPTKQDEVIYSCPACGRVLGGGVDPLAEQFEAAVRDLMGKPSPPAPTSRELLIEALAHDTSVSNFVDDDSEEDKQAGFMRRWQRPKKSV